MSAVVESLLDSGRYPFWLYATIWIWQCVLPACVFVCASVGERWGGGNNYSGERKKEIGGSRAFGAPHPTLAWFCLYALQKPKRRNLFHPSIHSIHYGLSTCTHTRADFVVPDIFSSVIQQNIERYCNKKSLHCAAWMPHMFFFISSRSQMWEESAQTYLPAAGGLLAEQLFRLLMHQRTQSHTWITLVWPRGTMGAHVIFYTLVFVSTERPCVYQTHYGFSGFAERREGTITCYLCSRTATKKSW